MIFMRKEMQCGKKIKQNDFSKEIFEPFFPTFFNSFCVLRFLLVFRRYFALFIKLF